MEQSKAHREKRTPLPTTKILICDDHPLFLLGLRVFLEQQEGICVVGEAQNADELLRQASRTRPSLIFLDMSTARRTDFEILRQLRELCPDTKVLVLTGYATSMDLVSAIQVGALGYLFKKSDPDHPTSHPHHSRGQALDPTGVHPSPVSSHPRNCPCRATCGQTFPSGADGAAPCGKGVEQQGNRPATPPKRLDGQGACQPHPAQTEGSQANRSSQICPTFDRTTGRPFCPTRQ